MLCSKGVAYIRMHRPHTQCHTHTQCTHKRTCTHLSHTLNTHTHTHTQTHINQTGHLQTRSTCPTMMTPPPSPLRSPPSPGLWTSWFQYDRQFFFLISIVLFYFQSSSLPCCKMAAQFEISWQMCSWCVMPIATEDRPNKDTIYSPAIATEKVGEPKWCITTIAIEDPPNKDTFYSPANWKSWIGELFEFIPVFQKHWYNRLWLLNMIMASLSTTSAYTRSLPACTCARMCQRPSWGCQMCTMFSAHLNFWNHRPHHCFSFVWLRRQKKNSGITWLDVWLSIWFFLCSNPKNAHFSTFLSGIDQFQHQFHEPRTT